MLQSLSIRNFILIDKLDLELKEGFCVITGETGSGKSILLKSILFCLSGKAYPNIIKLNAQNASVTAVFSSSHEVESILKEINIECQDVLVIKRIQTADNKKKLLINDEIVSQKTLDQIADCLFEVHGQNNHTILLNPGVHIDILDNYGDTLSLRNLVSEDFRKYQGIKREILEFTKKKENIDRETDYLAFVVDELSKTNVKIGEEESLSNIRRNLQDRDKETELLQELTNQLTAPEIDQAINRALRLINRNNKIDNDLLLVSKHLEDAACNLEEARSKIQSIANNFDLESYNLDEVETRLFTIRNLARKYSVSPDELPEFLEKSKQELNKLEQSIVNSENLELALKEAEKSYIDKAKALSEKRRQAATAIEAKVHVELQSLKMVKAVFKVKIDTNLDNFTEKGIDTACFIASTNPGQDLSPINKIASGGELSRFMLALKTSFFDKSSAKTIIFDEIDTGIGGIVAESVGERLKKLSKSSQVIVITHQPQVAKEADLHILVEKEQGLDYTTVFITTLSLEERALELARMISGKTITETGLKVAQELLEKT
jgi:DNA repair protein RecN (Recombination protein N)